MNFRSPRKKRLLVTGGAGFVGSNLADALLQKGFEVRIIDNFCIGRHERIDPRSELIAEDIQYPSKIRSAFEDVDCVFHMAALPRVPLSIAVPVATHMVNVVGTLNVLEAARDAGVRRFIYSSSASVYGDQPELPLREDMMPNPLNPYGLQKLVGEQYTRMFHRLFGMETLSLRYFSVFGPNMSAEGTALSAIIAFIRARRSEQPLTIYGDGTQTRDFIHVQDVIKANILAMDAQVADGRTLNVGQGKSVSINYIAALVGGLTINLPPRPGDARDTLADFSQAEKVLGWRPEVAIEDGIRKLMRSEGLK
jgi:nucleoside-diphosphate-sugar epimerase